VVCFHQFQKEFETIQPGAEYLFSVWPQLAPSVVAFAKLRCDNVDIARLLDELNNGGQGQTADANYKPPKCM
jgi:hypothetical protein